MADIVNIGLYPTAHTTASNLLDRFDTLIDVAKYAFAFAVKNKVQIIPVDISSTESKKTVWNVGSVDPDGYMVSLIGIIFNNTHEPYKQIEFLINAGLLRIHEMIESDPKFDIFSLL
ncbi:MAG: hypothetical protein GX285_06275 [Clostridiales bacterium]|nr:hypothetical protein [Clostridiales bacterium]